MKFDWNAAVAFIIARLQERTTWLGLLAFAGLIGWRVAPEHIELIVQSGLGLGGLLLVAVKDKPDTTVVLMAPASPG